MPSREYNSRIPTHTRKIRHAGIRLLRAHGLPLEAIAPLFKLKNRNSVSTICKGVKCQINHRGKHRYSKNPKETI